MCPKEDDTLARSNGCRTGDVLIVPSMDDVAPSALIGESANAYLGSRCLIVAFEITSGRLCNNDASWPLRTGHPEGLLPFHPRTLAPQRRRMDAWDADHLKRRARGIDEPSSARGSDRTRLTERRHAVERRTWRVERLRTFRVRERPILYR